MQFLFGYNAEMLCKGRLISVVVMALAAQGCTGFPASSSRAAQYVPRAFFDAFQHRQLIAEGAELMVLAQGFQATRQRWPKDIRELERFANTVERPVKWQTIRDVEMSVEPTGHLLLIVSYRPVSWQRWRTQSANVGLLLGREEPSVAETLRRRFQSEPSEGSFPRL
jgi:hypothetical protein